DAGGFERELKATAARRGLSQRVVFAGHQAKMVQVLQALDIVVHASVDEPFGRILIEAGAAALPVVAYASGGVPEIVVHEQTGLLAAAGDRSALALGVVRLIRTPALARTLGRAARVRVEQQFEVGRLTREIEEVFRRALRA
ncbi:MAG TPA: glycosyltransferase family 4 protein, partial [Candidatus Kryptonia bacterium]|nr:glycosyltransferase family 4 protein [Candidatus Kryptonia bacterium]